MADEDIIEIINPNLPGSKPVPVRRDAFEETWRINGFEEVDPVLAKVSAALKQPITDLADLKKEELSTAAARLNVPVGARATKPQIEKALTEAFTPVEEPEDETEGDETNG